MQDSQLKIKEEIKKINRYVARIAHAGFLRLKMKKLSFGEEIF